MKDIIPEAVSRLRLCSAFKGWNVPLIDCVECRNDECLYVTEDTATNVSRFEYRNVDVEKCFIGRNKKRKEICLLPIDHRLIDNHIGGIADCALFNTDTFCFIEFKLNAEGNNHKSVETTYGKAVSQLKNTFMLVRSKMQSTNTDFCSETEVTFNVVVARQFPRITATEQNMMIAFSLDPDTYGLELSFENSRDF